MNISKLCAAFGLGLATFAVAQTPASAASAITEAFLANLQPNVAFLDRSSKLALNHTDVAAIRAFAQGEARTMVAAAADPLVTGRSVAIEGTGARIGEAANGRTPLGAGDLASLDGLSGQAFADAYWTKQLDALSQIESDYRTYIAHGDDPALLAMAKSELPQVMRRLTELSKI